MVAVGDTAFTRMPWKISFAAPDLVRPTTPTFEACARGGDADGDDFRLFSSALQPVSGQQTLR